MYLKEMKLEMCPVKHVYRLEVVVAIPRDDDNIDVGTMLMPFRPGMTQYELGKNLHYLADVIDMLNGYEPYIWERITNNTSMDISDELLLKLRSEEHNRVHSRRTTGSRDTTQRRAS